MSILSDFEDSVSRAIEGVFAGVFRSRVQPAELAKALGKEMDRGRAVGVGKVYAPNLYTVVISPDDESRLGSFVDTLAAELATYLTGYAREKGYALDGRPVVRFAVHDSLKLGRFEAIGELVSAEELAEAADEAGFYVPESGSERASEAAGIPSAAVPADAPGAGAAASAAAGAALGAAAASLGPAAHPVPRPGPGVTLPPSAVPREQRVTIRALATVTVTGIEHDVVLQGDRVVVGRMSSCDIVLPDVNVSREHAAFVRDDDGWAIQDLHSTNGTYVNGSPTSRAHLRDGDTVGVGVTQLVYHGPQG